MKNSIYIFLLFLFSTVITTAQDTDITKSGNYTVNGTSTLEATNSITFLPDTHIISGSNFTASIVAVPSVSAIPYTSISFDNNRNYVFSRIFQTEMTAFNANTANESDVLEQLTYLDELGRPVQSLDLKASPDVEDRITHLNYDIYGRQPKQFLPAPSTGSIGSFRTNVESTTNSYYLGQYPADLNSSNPNPFAEMEYEASPLNRVLKQAAPGYDWRLGSGHEIRLSYESNSANEIRRFRVNFSGGNTEAPQLINDGFYNAGELLKNRTRDENWVSGSDDHSMEEFTDQYGRMVLKRTYESGIQHDTYYVYNDFDNLSFVIPPGVTTDNVSSSELDEFCYQYKYDQRNRLIEKKLPGKDWEFIVYDILDRPVLTQDPNLNAQNRWLFTKYDPFGRVAYTGSFPSSATRAQRQSFQDGAATPYENKTSGYLTVDGTRLYYSNSVLPTHNLEMHTINYYDDYNFYQEGINLPTRDILGQAQATNVKGLATGNKVRVLNTNDWITTITLYDRKGRPIYLATKNDYLNTLDIVETELDFAGKVLRTRTTHTKGNNTPIVTDEVFEYDHQARLVAQTHSINGSNPERIVNNTYDGIDQLVQKEVGGNAASNPLQTVDYSYNVRGWLKKINNPEASLGNDLFAFEIDYNEGNNALFNGNIAKTQWKTANDNILRSYNYTYDALNRIKTAIGGNTSNYNVSNISYDKMGNILTLNRNGHRDEAASVFGLMDKLIYSYTGNQLKAVDDTGLTSSNTGFIDGAELAVEYQYDANGNMIIDHNKGITNIDYNHLNLPTQVTINGNGNNGTIQYVYDATGIKLEKTVSENSSMTTTEYAGNYIYENNNLQFFNTPEGYVEPDGNSWDYIFQCKDHLGNIRLSYADNDGNGSISTAEIRKENNYYPFGLKHKGYNNSQSAARNHKYQYNGKEEQDELGLAWYDYGWRNYDASLGRWMNIDPLAEDYYYDSSFIYTTNNPVLNIDPDGRFWKSSIDSEGNITYTAEEGDSVETFQEQYDLEDGQAEKIIGNQEVKAGETVISGKQVEEVTGNEVLKLDLASSQAKGKEGQQRIFDQFVFAGDVAASRGEDRFYAGDFYSSLRAIKTGWNSGLSGTASITVGEETFDVLYDFTLTGANGLDRRRETLFISTNSERSVQRGTPLGNPTTLLQFRSFKDKDSFKRPSANNEIGALGDFGPLLHKRFNRQ